MQRLSPLVPPLSEQDANALPVTRVQAMLREAVQPVTDATRTPIRGAQGRVLAETVRAPIDVPAHDNAAMDGFAFASAELARGAGDLTLRVIGTAYASPSISRPPAPGEAVRIMTGAVMPAGCDTVIPQELTHSDAQAVRFARDAVRPGDNRRLRGEDLTQGSAALTAGRILHPADIGLLASLGIAEVSVHRRLRVAFFSTGDELRDIGDALDAGCRYDSNRYTLHGMLTRLNVEPIDLGRVRDHPEALETALRTAAVNADAVITSGGVSVGEADFTRQALARLGDIALWKIAMRPGRPMAFGRIGHGAVWFGLPGNPVAAMVAFYHLVRGALLRMMGATETPALLVPATSVASIRKRPGRTEYPRGIAALNDRGQLEVRLTGPQGSGILRSMSAANCFIVLAPEQGSVEAGDTVFVLLFDGLI